MTTPKELRALARDCRLPGRSKLKKTDLIKAIAEVRATEFIQRLQRAQKMGRHSAIRSYVENPHRKGRCARELCRIDDKVYASLWGKKYLASFKNKLLVRQQLLKQITGRS